MKVREKLGDATLGARIPQLLTLEVWDFSYEFFWIRLTSFQNAFPRVYTPRERLGLALQFKSDFK